MEDQNIWVVIIGAALPIVTGVLASLYISFKAKAAQDGVQDWKDDAVKAVDQFIEKTKQG